VVSPSVTFGHGSNLTKAPLNTFHLNSSTSVFNSFALSGTIAQNFVLSSVKNHQRVGAYAIKAGDMSICIYNDNKKLLGDGEDRWWTGGGSLTISNFFGNRNNSIRIGNDVFTGNSIPDMVLSAHKDALMPKYSYGNNKELNYAGQSTHDVSLNMGRSYFQYSTNNYKMNLFHSGKFNMFSQDLIHDLMDFHRFLSLTPNQINLSGGPSFGTYSNE